MLRKIIVNLILLGLLVAIPLVVVRMNTNPEPTARPEAQRELAEQVPQIAPTVQMKESRTSPRSDANRAARPPVAQSVPKGRALVTMRIPRFGRDWEWTALEGTSPEVLVNGPGHYPLTPMPGDKGNSGFAAHRAGHGDPFIDFDLLRPGDHILLAQGGTTWKYRVTTKPRIIDIDDVWILDPLPGRVLTLTTCWPKYGSSRRMFVRAALDSVDQVP
jgi:sortase A